MGILRRASSVTHWTFISYPLDRVDSLEERQKNFFSNCAKNKLKGSEKEEYESIRKEYQKVIEVYNLWLLTA